MAEARTRSVRIRSRAAGFLAAGYVVALTSFWVAGAAAYSHSAHGLSRWLGLAYFPILLLPVVGKGTLGGLEVHSSIWVWWFALQMILGVAAIWLYPYERPRRAAQVAGSLDWLESTSRGTGAVDHAILSLEASALARAGLGQNDRAAALLAEIEATPGARDTSDYAGGLLPAMVRTALGIGDRELAERLADGVEPRYPYAEHALVAANAALAEPVGTSMPPTPTPRPRIAGSGSGSSPSRRSRCSARAAVWSGSHDRPRPRTSSNTLARSSMGLVQRRRSRRRTLLQQAIALSS